MRKLRQKAGAGMTVYGGGNQLTPTGQSNAFANNYQGMTPEQIQEAAAKYGWRTDSPMNLQEDMYRYVTKNRPEIMLGMIQKYGAANAGMTSYDGVPSFAPDGMLGARSAALLGEIEKQQPVKPKRSISWTTLNTPDYFKDTNGKKSPMTTYVPQFNGVWSRSEMNQAMSQFPDSFGKETSVLKGQPYWEIAGAKSNAGFFNPNLTVPHNFPDTTLDNVQSVKKTVASVPSIATVKANPVVPPVTNDPRVQTDDFGNQTVTFGTKKKTMSEGGQFDVWMAANAIQGGINTFITQPQRQAAQDAYMAQQMSTDGMYQNAGNVSKGDTPRFAPGGIFDAAISTTTGRPLLSSAELNVPGIFSSSPARQSNYSAPIGDAGTDFSEDFAAKIRAKESSGNYKALPYKNGHLASSAVGAYQFLWKQHKDWIMDVTGVTSKEDFMNNPEAQDKAFAYWDHTTLTPAANKIKRRTGTSDSLDKIKARVHFSGEVGALDYYTSGKQTVDAFGSTTASYASQFKKGGEKRQPIYTDNRNDPRIRSYQDSLSHYNEGQVKLNAYKKIASDAGISLTRSITDLPDGSSNIFMVNQRGGGYGNGEGSYINYEGANDSPSVDLPSNSPIVKALGNPVHYARKPVQPYVYRNPPVQKLPLAGASSQMTHPITGFVQVPSFPFHPLPDQSGDPVYAIGGAGSPLLGFYQADGSFVASGENPDAAKYTADKDYMKKLIKRNYGSDYKPSEYAEGGEYELSDKEIKKILANGGSIEYL